MMDFGALPPEVNSARMYAGAGSGSMMAAASAWAQLASTLSSAAGSYRSVISGLTGGGWRGPASAAMAAAAEPYVQWMNVTAAQAEQTASQGRAAAAAYEAALAATVPPPVIAANRASLASLVASNTLGQNSAQIAANQSQYAEMWAQDASAMYSYAGRSAAATTLSPPAAAPQTTNPAGAAAQAGASGQSAVSSSAQGGGSMVSSLLAALGSPNPMNSLANVLATNPTFSAMNTFLLDVAPYGIYPSGFGFFSESMNLFLFPLYIATGKLALFAPLLSAASTASAGSAGAAPLSLAGSGSAGAAPLSLAGAGEVGVSAGLGRAASLGGLSVPASWGVAPQEIRLASTALPAALPQTAMAAPGGLLGAPVGGPLGSVVNTPRNGDARMRAAASVKASGAADADGATADLDELAVVNTMSESEQKERDRLRQEMSDLAMECKAMASLMREAMR